MTITLQETDVSIESLANHLDESGLNTTIKKFDTILLNTRDGYVFSVSLDAERKFIRLNAYFPIKKDYGSTLELSNTLNLNVFPGSFCVDDDCDLRIFYAITYETGLILRQFMRIIHRFSGMLDYLVREYDKEEDIFEFKTKEDSPVVAETRSIQ